jgi:hypothetical protein
VTAPAEMPVAELQTLLASLSTAANKGAALEDFCAVFFNAVPGITVTGRNVVDNVQSQELDLVLDNARDPNGLEFLKTFVFVEAKNWGDPVGSAEVAWLDWKIRMGGDAVDGVLVVSSGVTGLPDERTSAWAILKWANVENRRIFVMSPTEMANCVTFQDVYDLFMQKWRRLVTGKSPLDPSEIRPL